MGTTLKNTPVLPEAGREGVLCIGHVCDSANSMITSKMSPSANETNLPYAVGLCHCLITSSFFVVSHIATASCHTIGFSNLVLPRHKTSISSPQPYWLYAGEVCFTRKDLSLCWKRNCGTGTVNSLLNKRMRALSVDSTIETDSGGKNVRIIRKEPCTLCSSVCCHTAALSSALAFSSSSADFCLPRTMSTGEGGMIESPSL